MEQAQVRVSGRAGRGSQGSPAADGGRTVAATAATVLLFLLLRMMAVTHYGRHTAFGLAGVMNFSDSPGWSSGRSSARAR